MTLSMQRDTWESSNPTFIDIVKQRIQEEQERSSLITITIELPECLIIEILSWLPVKSLLQFKSVCKSWYSIITSPLFISKHVRNYYNNSQELCLLVQHHVPRGLVLLTELLVDKAPHAVAYNHLSFGPLDPRFLCGPCDGLYFVYVSNLQFRALWNPALNEMRLVPELIQKPNLPPDLTYCADEDFGFGIDPITNDYKVVIVVRYLTETDHDETTHPASVFVYSLRTDSWKYCGDLSQRYKLEYNKCHVFVHGCYYWLGNYENPEVLISFDMATDAFQEFQAPHQTCKDVSLYDETYCKKLGIYDDSLALFAFHKVEQNLDMWTFNDGNWSKIFSVGPLCGIVDVIGHWKDSKLFLEGQDWKLVVYDIDTHEMNDVGFEGDHELSFDGIQVYKESLVSIMKIRCEGNETNA